MTTLVVAGRLEFYVVLGWLRQNINVEHDRHQAKANFLFVGNYPSFDRHAVIDGEAD
jgi:hypothetical protein